MKELIAELFAIYGQVVTAAADGGEQSWQAFVQPILRDRSEEARAYTPIGDVDKRQWLYIGPADRVLQRGDSLRSGGQSFIVRELSLIHIWHTPPDFGLHAVGERSKKGEEKQRQHIISGHHHTG